MPAHDPPGPLHGLTRCTTPLTPRRAKILEAALDVVVEQGMRGLTHRAVDREASLPEGSTSGYFRTRRALLVSLATYVRDLLAGDVDRLTSSLSDHDISSGEEAVLVADLFTRWLTDRRPVLARLELTLEAARDAEIAEVMVAARAEVVQLTALVLEQHGRDSSHKRAATTVAALDGLLLAAIPMPEAERSDFLRDALELLLSSLDPGPA